jgi:2-oxoisovalerate dehydrogenase E1 component
MGGRRGYGPTHSQTLDRFLIGIDNVKTIALNTLINPEIIYGEILKETDPVVVIENKSDYGKYIGFQDVDNYKFMVNHEAYPVVKISPLFSKPNLTIVTYGGMAGEVIESLPGLFEESDFKTEVLILTKINPVDYTEIIKSVEVTRRLVVIEEGSSIGGVSSEIISSIVGLVSFHVDCHKIGALAVPIPSVKSLESQVLPNKNTIINALKVI